MSFIVWCGSRSSVEALLMFIRERAASAAELFFGLYQFDIAGFADVAVQCTVGVHTIALLRGKARWNGLLEGHTQQALCRSCVTMQPIALRCL